MLVDDEPSNLQVLRHTLQDSYRLVFTINGSNALELALKEQPDSILLKPGKLTDQEWEVMWQHTIIGARIIGVHFDPTLVDAFVRCMPDIQNILHKMPDTPPESALAISQDLLLT